MPVNWCGYWGHICHPKFTENVSRLRNLWSPKSLYHCFVFPCSPAKLQHGRLWRSHLWLSKESKTSENTLWCVVAKNFTARDGHVDVSSWFVLPLHLFSWYSNTVKVVTKIKFQLVLIICQRWHRSLASSIELSIGLGQYLGRFTWCLKGSTISCWLRFQPWVCYLLH